MTTRHTPDRPAKTRGRNRRRSPLQLWGPIILLVVAVVAGIAFQSARSHTQAPQAAPAHALGPNGGELLGRASAPVLVEEYGDFQCPVCGQWERSVYPTVRQLVDDLLFADQAPENSGVLTTDRLLELGRQVGLTSQQFQRKVRDGTYDNWIRQATDQSSQCGVNQTPTVLVNGQQVDAALTAQGLLAAVNAAANASGS
jgi:protein-disulfide isomerase